MNRLEEATLEMFQLQVEKRKINHHLMHLAFVTHDSKVGIHQPLK